MNYLLVVDMQVDFITGSLGSDLAAAIVPNVLKKSKILMEELSSHAIHIIMII